MALSVESDQALKLPEEVKQILVTGAGGFVGQKLVKGLLGLYPDVKIISTDIVPPPNHGIEDENRLVSVKTDLGDLKAVESLFGSYGKIDLFYILHGIMSGQSEQDFQLGWSVNVDSHVNVLRTAAAHGKTHGFRPRYVYTSSLAVYGGPKCTPESYVKPQETPVLALSSYGVQKQIIELYAYDYGRKGLVDTRSVRLPTVTVRPGAPSSAASSFISGLIREPLTGKVSECPIAASFDDPIWDDMPVYVSRTSTVVRNIIYAGVMDESKLQVLGGDRTTHLPGISVTPRKILDALVQHGGKDKLDLIQFKPDELVIRICKTWAGEYDSSAPLSMGFKQDDLETGFSDAVAEFKAELESAK